MLLVHPRQAVQDTVRRMGSVVATLLLGNSGCTSGDDADAGSDGDGDGDGEAEAEAEAASASSSRHGLWSTFKCVVRARALLRPPLCQSKA